MKKQVLLKEVLAEHIKSVKLGVIVKSIRNISPIEIINELAVNNLYVSIVGYEDLSTKAVGDITISTRIEDAVLWRSDPSKSGRIIVFINGEVDKLHSLAEFDVITSRSLMRELLDRYAVQLQNNEPARRLIEYLISHASQYTYEDIDDFLHESESDWGVCGDHLWMLNHLCDHEILSKKEQIYPRLDNNRELVDTLGILPDSTRQAIYRTLSKYGNNQEITDTFLRLSKYVDSADKNDLRGLEYDKVKTLLNGRKEIAPIDNPASRSGSGGGQSTPPKKPKDVKMAEFEEKVASIIVDQDKEEIALLTELFNSIKECLAHGDNPVSITSGGELFDNRPLRLDVARGDFRKIIGMLCNEASWGGKLMTKETVLRSALYFNYDHAIYHFNPYDNSCSLSIEGTSIIETIRRFDELLGSDSRYKPLLSIFERMSEARKKLVNALESLMFFPTILFGADEDYYNILKDYISSWQALLNSVCNNEPLMRGKSIQWTPALIKCILSLDILYLKTANDEWKSVLMPTHPLHLWKYYEIFRNLHEDKSTFKDRDFEELKKVLHSLPQTLNFMVIDKFISGQDNIELPYSGNVEMLPAYENKTNRYLGRDGIECVRETILRWLEFAPYSNEELRIAITDAPDVNAIVKDAKSLIEEGNCNRINITFFYTRAQKEGNDFAIFDYAETDDETLFYISEGNLQISSHNIKEGKDEINRILGEYPVHIAFFFDQLEYSIGHAQNNKCLYISPLVVTYDYQFDDMSKRGEIYPSSDMDSGMIGDYQMLLCRANMISSSDVPHASLSNNNSVKHVTNTIVSGQTQWLVVSDRSISEYQPDNSFPIGEKDYGRRKMSIWASEESRVIMNYVKLLRQYNLYPEPNNLVHVLSEFGHISSEGLVTIPKVGASRMDSEKKQKGLLGTVFSAYWYTKNNPGALIASLDDNDARLWLSNLDTTNERADLIGLKYDASKDKLTIQPIEVKTWTSDSNDPVNTLTDPVSKDTLIQGHAADQVAMTTKLLSAIFGKSDEPLNIFSAARKEALKYHVVSECFRANHPWEWQKNWSHLLKRAFSGNNDFDIEIKGIVIYVDLQSSSSSFVDTCRNSNIDDIVMSYARIGTDTIQKEILDSQTTATSINTHVETTTPESTENTTGPQPKQHLSDRSDDSIVDNSGGQTAEDSINTRTNSVPSEPQVTVSVEPSTNVEIEEIRKYINSFKRSCFVYNINLDYCDEAEQAIIGPSIIRVHFSLKRGQSLKPLQSHIEDISREMERSGVIVQPVPNSNMLNLDIPRKTRDTILFTSVVDKLPSIISPEQLFFTLGRTPDGKDLICNLSEMPHMLVAGSTGSGKTVFLFTLLASLLKTHKSPKELKILLSSSGLEDFILFNDIPHLIGGKVIDDADEATEMIRTTVIQEFDRRADILTQAKVPNIIEYNKVSKEKLAPIVVIIDEFADLSDQLSTKQEKESFFVPVKRIAQIGRKRGIHLVLCTQRPSATLVPSNIKSQIAGRVALRVNDGNSSRMILEDSGDAKFLLNHGDMIYKNGNINAIERAQGYYISTNELAELIEEIKSYNE